ncbi:PBP1b-binding outer membrane lipoprotein LpoB [Rhabdobacter roseus]|uniref:PBP1b-binding outer membrane lipoprotein LpoB n=1 Tax=Rhabdobacter roseus TaxID=1655419 RepID=A0A840TT53_9BACT|nr:hypothetical protein [Rhabdobacter roseus]MBB5286464.1 PBP1b-binding outer membrane lipoprotein LpoB [Rhabdobacter roseus]
MKTKSPYIAMLALGLLIATGCSRQAAKRADRANAANEETVNKTEGYFYHDNNTQTAPGDTTQKNN